jgi:hypothetical protein
MPLKPHHMKQLLFTVSLIMIFASCGQDSAKQKELELKEKELALKEKELELKEKEIRKDTVTSKVIDNSQTTSTEITVTYQSLNSISENVDMAYFKGDDLICYFDQKTKGKIIIDNVSYPLSSEKRTDKGNFVNYTYTGNGITIKAMNGKFEDIGEDEERDVYNANFPAIEISTDKGSVTLKNVTLRYSVMNL